MPLFGMPCRREVNVQIEKLACALVVMAAVAAEAAESRMDRAKLQIGTYYLHPVAQTEAHVKAMKDCGIDFVFGVDADRREALDLLARHGIGCVATGVFPGWGGGDGRHAGQLEKMHPLAEYVKAAKAFKDHPAIWMVDVGDEPSALEFPYYARLIPEVRKHLPKGVVPYLNLYPNYAQVTKNTDAQQLSQLGTATYGEHIDRYAAAIPLDYLSYDFYVYSARPQNFDSFLAKMYDNFETVAASCRKTGRSFWYIPQVNNVFETYHMSPNRLRFQAFTALAYGAEVINWACWMKGWWTHNVVNPDGTTNEYEYFILKTVNRELHALGPDYMRYRNVATHKLGFDISKKALDLAAFKDISVAEGGRLVVGEMRARRGEGAAFLAVASDDPHDAGAPRKTLVFKPTGAFRVLRPTGFCDATPEADGFVRLPLASAEAILVMTK